MTGRFWPRRPHRRDRCGPRAPRSPVFPQDGGTKRSGPRCSSDCRLPNCTSHRWQLSSPTSLLPSRYIYWIRRLSHPLYVLLRDYFGHVVEELPEFRVIGRLPVLIWLVSRPLPDDFPRYAAPHLTFRYFPNPRKQSPRSINDD